MQQRLLTFWNGVKDRWNSLTNSGKLKIVLSVSAVIIALAALIYFAVKPRMTVLLSGLEFTAGMDGTSLLEAEGIQSEFDKGELRVREEDASRAAKLLTDSDSTILRSEDTSFANAMNLITMGTTEATRREIMLNQKQNELANDLRMYDGVVSAVVTLYIPPDDRFFIREEQKATCGVILNTDKEISGTIGENMARFICKGIKGLNMEDVIITNQNGETIYSGASEAELGSPEQYELERLQKADIERQVRNQVAPMYDTSSILLKLDINNDRLQEEMLRYEDPNPTEGQQGFPTTESSMQSSVTGGSPQDAPGIDANDQVGPTYNIGEDAVASAKTKEEQVSYVYDEIRTSRNQALGVINYGNSALSIKLIQKQEYYEEDLPQYIQENGLPETTTWRQFQNGTQEFIQLENDANLENIRTNISVGTGINNVHLIAFRQSLFFDSPVPPVNYQNYIILAILALLILLLLYGFVKKTQQDEVTEVEPELSVEDLLVSTQLEEEKEATTAEQLAGIEFNQQSEALKQIENFINERPEAVAQLLRNWMNEEWE
ncbi:MAG: hypothetical protein LBS21_13330 [Clostridiales bacterium]|jgi:flagellar M-ring protein FliF|nr:hypothetical protein [Clostridiales bacterium]